MSFPGTADVSQESSCCPSRAFEWIDAYDTLGNSLLFEMSLKLSATNPSQAQSWCQGSSWAGKACMRGTAKLHRLSSSVSQSRGMRQPHPVCELRSAGTAVVVLGFARDLNKERPSRPSTQPLPIRFSPDVLPLQTPR